MEERATDIAQTILRQLGGQRFIAMTGAKSFAGGGRELTFRLPATMTRGRASGMRITLDPDDTYTVQTLKTVRFEAIVLDTREGVHVGELRGVFTAMTGLDTSLGRVR